MNPFRANFPLVLGALLLVGATALLSSRAAGSTSGSDSSADANAEGGKPETVDDVHRPDGRPAHQQGWQRRNRDPDRNHCPGDVLIVGQG